MKRLILMAVAFLLVGHLALAATTQDFDTTGTPWVGANYTDAAHPNTAPLPAVLSGGPTGNFLRLKDYTIRTFNAVGFDRTDAVAATRIIADVDFRVTCRGDRDGFGPGGFNGCANGPSMIFLNTSRYGTSGAPPPFDEAGRQATSPVAPSDSFAVGFQFFNDNRVYITYNNVILSSFAIDRNVLDMATGTHQNPGIFLHLFVDLVLGGPNPNVTVVISSPSATVTPFLDFSLAGVTGLGPYESRLGFGTRSGDAGLAVDLDNINIQFQTGTPPVTTPPVVSSLCGPSNPAPISGSTGEQGVLDPTNTDPNLGLVWPASAMLAGIDIVTGQVLFFDSSAAQVGTATLPGVSGFPAFPGGKLNFTSVRLGSGKQVLFFSFALGFPPPLILLSCQDVILETGSLLAGGGRLPSPVVFTPTGQLTQFPAAFLGSFGPRSGSQPTPGSLYPPIGGGGGSGGTFTLPGGMTVPGGGQGGPGIVIAAAQRITVNGTILAAGNNITVGEGGAGGSVRLAAVLVEGNGTIDTGGGQGSSGLGPSGPIEIQAFVQNLFSGGLSGTPSPCTTSKDCPVAAPLPDNLPGIAVDRVYTALQPTPCPQSGCPNTGSLTTPDITLSAASSPVTVTADVFTYGVPLGTQLVFRAVGTDGIAVESTANVSACTGCNANEGIASASLTLNPGVTYQLVVYPSVPLLLARGDGGPSLQVRPPSLVRWGQAVSAGSPETFGRAAADTASLEKWARAFGVDLRAVKNLAKLRTATDHSR